MKKWITMVLAVVLVGMLALPALAVQVQPRWTESARIGGNFDISASGTASFKVNTQADGANKIVMSVKLQKDTGSGWKNVKTWSATSNSRAVSKSGSQVVKKGAEYQLVISSDVYVGGSLVETAEEVFSYGYFG